MVTRKKRAYKERILNQMIFKRNEKNLKDFWKLLGKVSSKNNHDSTILKQY